MARTAQRCLMEALDRSKSATITIEMVGTHRRVELEDLHAYARQMRANPAAALQRMADDADEPGLDY